MMSLIPILYIVRVLCDVINLLEDFVRPTGTRRSTDVFLLLPRNDSRFKVLDRFVNVFLLLRGVQFEPHRCPLLGHMGVSLVSSLHGFEQPIALYHALFDSLTIFRKKEKESRGRTCRLFVLRSKD